MAAHVNGRRLTGGFFGVVVASSLVLLPTGPAAAAKPDIVKIPGATSTILHQECGFPVREDSVSRQGVVQVFFDRNGEPRTVHVAGSFTGTLTHVLPDGTDGASVRINFSGPGNFDPASGDLSGRGPWLLGSPDDPGTAEFDGFLWLVRGQVSASINSDTGVLTIHEITGNVTDLCAVLA
jgi:hypothetical protein